MFVARSHTVVMLLFVVMIVTSTVCKELWGWKWPLAGTTCAADCVFKCYWCCGQFVEILPVSRKQSGVLVSGCGHRTSVHNHVVFANPRLLHGTGSYAVSDVSPCVCQVDPVVLDVMLPCDCP